MRHIFVWKYFLLVFAVKMVTSTLCGCKQTRACYQKMVEELIDDEENEAKCISDASIGYSTYVVYFKALETYCGDIFNVSSGGTTYDNSQLYEVVINRELKSRTNGDSKVDKEKPVIVIDAGQSAGEDSVRFALYIIERLTACEEYDDMIHKARWVIMPSTNPDGMKYSRYTGQHYWTKNTREFKNSMGVDISRNFNSQWNICNNKNNAPSSLTYSGPAAGSENETMFIKTVLNKNRERASVYLSLRSNGHCLLYPYGYSKSKTVRDFQLLTTAAAITTKVNQRAGTIQFFTNQSISEKNIEPICGHSVDFAYDLGYPLAYEMRVFIGEDFNIMLKYQPLPKGYENALRNGYFTGIRELYNIIVSDKKFEPVYSRANL